MFYRTLDVHVRITANPQAENAC